MGEAQFMVDFQGMHLNAKKALYNNFKKHSSIVCREMLITTNDGGYVRWYVLTTGMCATTNKYSPIEDRYSSLICKHALENTINVS